MLTDTRLKPPVSLSREVSHVLARLQVMLRAILDPGDDVRRPAGRERVDDAGVQAARPAAVGIRVPNHVDATANQPKVAHDGCVFTNVK